MKNFLLSVFFILITTWVFAFDLPTSINNALKTGNAAVLSGHFSKTVDLSIPGNEGMYSKNQSELILKKFFASHKPTSFKVLNNGDAKNNTHYSIGNLKSGEKNYRVYILYSSSENKATILELRIEQDN